MALHKGFCDIQEVLPDISVRAAYFYPDNFTGARVDGYERNAALGTIELVQALKAVREKACESGYGLLIWDAFRPVRAVECFVRWAQQPEDYSTKAVHYPNVDKRDMFRLGYIAEKSGHSRGSTVDLTLTDRDGQPIDMGTIFDFMDVSAHHDNQLVSRECTDNRNLLRSIMVDSGFKPYHNEWWHYTLVEEPYPNSYFDFPIE